MKVLVKYNAFSDEFFIVLPDDVVEQLELVADAVVTIHINNSEIILEKDRHNILSV